MNDDSPSPHDSDVYEMAAGWWVKCDAGPLSRADRAAFEAWLAADPAHKAEFDKIEPLLAEMRALGPTGEVKAPRRRFARPSSLFAASLFAFLVTLVMFDELSLAWRADFRTKTGETRLVTLADGSRVQLAARSAIAVNFQGTERKLALLDGEAWFQAAPNAARPFVVTAAGGTVTALGTAFDISLEDSRAEVAVTEHQVSVASGGKTVIVKEGEESAFGSSAPPEQPAPVDLERVGAWRRGRLVFDDKPLGEVVTILTRYHHGLVFIPDPAVKQIRVSGVFDAADPQGALAVIESSLGLHAFHFTNYLVVLRE